ncbi:MAG: hypothetical protein QOD91_2676, partial [Frankiales bacterium]|nr:hypothetical protein [Frankiales bacterium]
ADHRAYEAYAQEKTYRPNQSVSSTFHDEISEAERPGEWRRGND